jgi:hypothetical protein
MLDLPPREDLVELIKLGPSLATYRQMAEEMRGMAWKRSSFRPEIEHWQTPGRTQAARDRRTVLSSGSQRESQSADLSV